MLGPSSVEPGLESGCVSHWSVDMLSARLAFFIVFLAKFSL